MPPFPPQLQGSLLAVCSPSRLAPSRGHCPKGNTPPPQSPPCSGPVILPSRALLSRWRGGMGPLQLPALRFSPAARRGGSAGVGGTLGVFGTAGSSTGARLGRRLHPPRGLCCLYGLGFRTSGWAHGGVPGGERKPAKARGHRDPARTGDADGPLSQQGACGPGLGGRGGRAPAMLAQKWRLILNHSVRWQLKEKCKT